MAQTPTRRPPNARIVRIVGVLILVAAAVFLAWRFGLFRLHNRAVLTAAVDRARTVQFVAPLFVAIYALGAAFGVPATPFTLAGGALFGVAEGFVLNWAGELTAALIAFAVTRATGIRAGPKFDKAASSRDALATDRRVATLFRLRLIPVVPFSLLNAGAALSGMRWRDFILATAFGIVPVTVIYTVSAAQLMSGARGSGERALETALICAAGLVALTFIPAVIRRIRGARGATPS